MECVLSDSPVSRQQRTIHLPQDLDRLIEGLRELCGAKLNTLALASFLKFLFENPTGIDDIWISSAVAVERGDVPISGIPKWVARERECRAFIAVSDMNIAGLPEDDPRRKYWHQQVVEAQRFRADWKNVLDKDPDPIRSLIDFWKAKKLRYEYRQEQAEEDREVENMVDGSKRRKSKPQKDSE